MLIEQGRTVGLKKAKHGRLRHKSRRSSRRYSTIERMVNWLSRQFWQRWPLVRPTRTSFQHLLTQSPGIRSSREQAPLALLEKGDGTPWTGWDPTLPVENSVMAVSDASAVSLIDILQLQPTLSSTLFFSTPAAEKGSILAPSLLLTKGIEAPLFYSTFPKGEGRHIGYCTPHESPIPTLLAEVLQPERPLQIPLRVTHIDRTPPLPILSFPIPLMLLVQNGWSFVYSAIAIKEQGVRRCLQPTTALLPFYALLLYDALFTRARVHMQNNGGHRGVSKAHAGLLFLHQLLIDLRRLYGGLSSSGFPLQKEIALSYQLGLAEKGSSCQRQPFFLFIAKRYQGGIITCNRKSTWRLATDDAGELCYLACWLREQTGEQIFFFLPAARWCTTEMDGVPSWKTGAALAALFSYQRNNILTAPSTKKRMVSLAKRQVAYQQETNSTKKRTVPLVKGQVVYQREPNSTKKRTVPLIEAEVVCKQVLDNGGMERCPIWAFFDSHGVICYAEIGMDGAFSWKNRDIVEMLVSYQEEDNKKRMVPLVKEQGVYQQEPNSTKKRTVPLIEAEVVYQQEPNSTKKRTVPLIEAEVVCKQVLDNGGMERCPIWAFFDSHGVICYAEIGMDGAFSWKNRDVVETLVSYQEEDNKKRMVPLVKEQGVSQHEPNSTKKRTAPVVQGQVVFQQTFYRDWIEVSGRGKCHALPLEECEQRQAPSPVEVRKAIDAEEKGKGKSNMAGKLYLLQKGRLCAAAIVSFPSSGECALSLLVATRSPWLISALVGVMAYGRSNIN